MRAQKLYERLPIFLQNVACSVSGLGLRRKRYNSSFHAALRFLEESQWWSLARQVEYQNGQLRRIVHHAYETVPYYREMFDRLKLKPGDVRTASDLGQLPLLDKRTIRERFEDLRSTEWPEHRCIRGQTGGTTGTALNLLYDPDNEPWQWAVWWRHRRRFGLKVHDSYVNFAGRYVVPLSSAAPPIWRRNLAMRQTYVSVHHLAKQNLPVLTDYLQTRKVIYYSGYPSALYLFASYLKDNGIRLRYPPRTTSTGSETLLPHQRDLIEDALDTEVCDQYGASEHCGNISECEMHRYHVDMEFGIVEFLPIRGLPHRFCKIVCTGLRNYAMPLIRYDIGDVAEISDEYCPCGRESPVIKSIDGRIESDITTPDGRQLGRLDFLFKNTAHVVEAQLIQVCPDELLIKIVRTPTFSQFDESALVLEMRKYLGQVIGIKIAYVDEIPREANGKFRQIVSKVFPDRYGVGT